ncbi:MAG: hypothetical protein F6J86_12600 [Symploca sp. SIO1B1]|nr:hypothetical protein [Symploca sp. SIO1B1]
MIQWAGAFRSEYIWYYLPNPWMFTFLIHAFPLFGSGVSFLTWRKNTKKVFQRIIDYKFYLPARSKVIIVLFVCIITTIVAYLYYIPLYKTGLWAIFNDFTSAAQARENSLKLITNPLIKYSYLFVLKVFAPLLSVFLFNRFVFSMKKKSPINAIVYIALLLGLLVVVSFSGARTPAAYIALIIYFSFLLRKGLPVNPFYTIAAFIIVLSLPTVLTLWREGREVNAFLFWNYLSSAMLQRLFHLPMLTGLWHIHYAQNQGFIGVAGIPKLAVLLNIEPINMANLIGITYTNSRIESVSANTCYLFSYYSYFGWLSFPICLLGLWLLDYSVWIYRQLSDIMLLPCVASASLSSLFCISSDYTTVWLTHGFGIILILSLVLDIWCTKKKVIF